MRYALLLAILFINNVIAAPQSVDIQKIEAYLNNLRSLTADFVQISTKGPKLYGKIYLKRPGQMRLEYKPPAKFRVVASDGMLMQMDTDSGFISTYGINNTPAEFLLKKNIRLGKDLKVISIQKSKSKTIVSLSPKGGGASITLFFKNTPKLQLKGWRIKDPQGVTTIIELANIKFGVSISGQKFDIEN